MLRYDIDAELGHGATGTVYRAWDRVARQFVALKMLRASLPADALAHEFEVLARLRHPRVVRVLDYGFGQRPYYVMTYLAEATPLQPTIGSRDDHYQRLAQLLDAVAYLHQHGIIHRDLKPTNILLIDDGIQVVDFGLALARPTRGIRQSGTLAYIAPEVLHGTAVSARVDMYAIGVIAYELLTGQHPFQPEREGFISRVLYDDIDTQDLAARHGDSIADWVTHLLHKDPQQRPDSETARRAFGRIVQPSLALPALQASYLRAAPLTGRDTEMSLLQAAVHRSMTAAESGEAWLISGEGGVGKTRLLDAVATYARLQSCTVIHLNAGMQSSITLVEALDTHLQRLLSRPVSTDVVRIPKQRVQFIRQALNDLSQPVVLLLDDIHLTNRTDIDTLLRLSRTMPLLVVAAARSDTLTVTDSWVNVHRLNLPRLTFQQSADLIDAMLPARLRAAVDETALFALTEGNAFFLIETLHHLVQKKPDSDQPAVALQLPASVADILQTRLNRVPARAQPGLLACALYNRHIDHKIAAYLVDDVDAWLRVCQPVLERTARGWQFAHDRLRSAIIDRYDPTPDNHARVARAIEAVYADSQFHAPALAHHWRAAKQPEHEARYLIPAVKAHQQRDHYRAMQRTAERACEVLQTTGAQLLLLEAQYHMANYDAALSSIKQLLNSPDATPEQILHAQYRQADIIHTRSDHAAARVIIDRIEAMLEQRDKTIDAELRVKLHLLRGRTHYLEGDYEQARAAYAAAQPAAMDFPARQAEYHNALGLLDFYQRDYVSARAAFQRSKQLADDQAEMLLVCVAIVHIGMTWSRERQFERARTAYEQAMPLVSQFGKPLQEASVLINLAIVYESSNDPETAIDLYQQALAILRDIDHPLGIANVLHNMSVVHQRLLRKDEAIAFAKDALRVRQEINNQAGIISTSHQLGTLYYLYGQYDDARIHLNNALQLAQQTQISQKLLAIYESLVNVALDAGNPEVARRYFATMRSHAERDSQLLIPMLGASLFARLGDFDEAYRHLKYLLQHYDNRARVLYVAMDVYEADNRPQVAAWFGGYLMASSGLDDHIKADIASRRSTLEARLGLLYATAWEDGQESAPGDLVQWLQDDLMSVDSSNIMSL